MGRKNGKFSVLLIRYWNQKWFSELFSLEWEGKTFDTEIRNVLFAFGLVREIENDSSSVRALGIRKWFLDFVSGMEVSSRNSHLMHLLKELLVEMFRSCQNFLFGT
ncbi:hypothetical protein C1645_831836 [Glomus cerebriforme]|uniref:Uncharacterized protein n=1 Tax=Glomus cerebriforme TaxID=658196 RepID=A0A397SJ99_9GLOM|nr:hypothetical protein C1645_831836 [Glomus cerebriforme]